MPHRRRMLGLVLGLVGSVAACPATPPGVDGEGEGEGEGGFELPPGPAAFSYVEVAGSVCANGTATGLGISPGEPGARALLVVFNGGGACWDANSCFLLNAATHLNSTYTDEVLQADVAPLAPSGLTERADPDNPFTRAHMAFLPYCTADLHAGDEQRYYQVDLLGNLQGVAHRGRANTVLFAEQLARSFTEVDQVFLVGISAGGFGAMLNHDAFAAAFPEAQVHLLADGAPLVAPQNGLYGVWRNTWNMHLPEGCTECESEFAAVVRHLRTTGPARRFALVTTTNDEVIRTYFGYGLADLTPQVNALVDAEYVHDNAKAFVAAGTQHVLLGAYGTLSLPGGATLKSFVDAWAAGDDTWATARP